MGGPKRRAKKRTPVFRGNAAGIKEPGPFRSDWIANAPGQPSENAMRLDAIKIGKNPPDDVNVVIEVPIGGEPIKYEMDKESGALFVDRFLYTPMRYPGNYGFIPHTLSDDGDQ